MMKPAPSRLWKRLGSLPLRDHDQTAVSDAIRDKQEISHSEVFTYSIGSFATGVFSTVPSVLLLYYCTETLGIAAAIAGIIMLLPKIWSIVWDPLVGNLSDRSRHRWGRRRPFMIAGNIGMVVAFIMLFSGPALSPIATIFWVGVAYFGLATLYSLFAVPYIAIPAEIASDKTDVSRLVSARMMTSMVGILAGAAGAPLLIAWVGGGRHGYSVMGWVIAAACFVMMLAPVFMMRDRDRTSAISGSTDEHATNLFADMHIVLGNHSFRRLALAYLSQATSFGAFSAISPYLVTRAFGRPESDIGIAFGIYLIATISSIPIWSYLGKRTSMTAALIWSVLFYGIFTIVLGICALLHVEWTVALIGFGLAGIPFAGLQVLPFTMVGDVIRTSGTGVEGRFTGVWTATEKLGLSLGPAVVGLVLSIVGTGNLVGIGMFVCLMPPICIALTLAALKRK
jgi:glycoside/pentoside/hexuronide:cation symporter, GPH family